MPLNNIKTDNRLLCYSAQRRGLSELFFSVLAGLLFAFSAVSSAEVEFKITDPSFAISPEKTAKLLGNKQYTFVDIREPVEFQARHIPGFKNIRLGDLIAGSGYLKLDKKMTIVLICEAGERGSAVAAFLRLKGYQTLFVEKGIRGWIAQKQKFVGSEAGEGLSLPEFKNKFKEIKNEDARALIAEGKAVLVDLRTAVEYNKGHVEGALNIPYVNMPMKAVEKALKELPKGKMVIGIVYDRYSYYYSMVLGYMLDQRKLQYGGMLKLQTKNQAL